MKKGVAINKITAEISRIEYNILSLDIKYGVASIGAGAKFIIEYKINNADQLKIKLYETVKIKLNDKIIFTGYVASPELSYSNEDGTRLTIQAYTGSFLISKAFFNLEVSNVNEKLSIKDFLEQVKFKINEKLNEKINFIYNENASKVLSLQTTINNLYGKKYEDVLKDVLSNFNIYYLSTPEKPELVFSLFQNKEKAAITLEELMTGITEINTQYNYAELASKYIVNNNQEKVIKEVQTAEIDGIFSMFEKHINAGTKPDSNKNYATNAKIKDISNSFILTINTNYIYSNNKEKKLWQLLDKINITLPELKISNVNFLIFDVNYNFSQDSITASLTLKLPEEEQSEQYIPFLK